MSLLRRGLVSLLLLLQAALLLQAGCAGTPGGNPAVAPAPLAEIPAQLQIPSNLSINVEKTSTTSGAPLLLMKLMANPYLAQAFSKFLSSGTCGDGVLDSGEQCDDGNTLSGDGCDSSCQIENFKENMAFSSNLELFTNARLSALLGPLSKILIPVDPNLHKMDEVVFIGTTGYIARLDFGDFDLDGVGGTEGCSGNTQGLPICVRVWADDGVHQTRLLAARFDNYPLPENPGSGSLRGVDITFAGVTSFANVAANYNHIDPTNKFTDSFFGLLIEIPFPPPPTTSLIQPIRAFVSQLGPDDTALKTVNGNSIDTESGDFAKQFGRWLEGADKDFWIGSFQSSNPLEQFQDQCVRISTGEGVDTATFCTPLGLDTKGLDFLPFTQVSDLELFDFPDVAP